jgi:hypothetical protein
MKKLFHTIKNLAGKTIRTPALNAIKRVQKRRDAEIKKNGKK